MPNLNYPNYSQGFGGYGSYQPTAPSAPNLEPTDMGDYSPPSGGNFTALLGALAGTGLNAYGTYKQGQQADRDYQHALEAWQAEQARQKELDQQAKQQQGRTNEMNAGQYAQGLMHDAYGSYSPWTRR